MYIIYICKFIVTPEVSSISRKLKKGDILFAGSGETKEEIGKCASLLSNDIVFAGGDIVILSPDKDNSKFLGYLLNSPYVVKQKSSKGQGDAVVHISSGSLSKISICLPTVNEQSLIAQTLSDTDELITSLDAFIEKKGQIKEGTMQELLTGKRRLPGFSGDWEVKKLGEICEIKKGQLITESTRIDGEIPVIAGGKQPAYFHSKSNRKGKTITISGSGASAGYVAFHSYPIFASDCSTIEESTNYSIEFIYYFLQLNQHKIYRSQTGGAQPHIHPSDLKPMMIQCPNIEYQYIIAGILSDIDAEITSLKSKRDKYQRIKEGMMQELLTGNIRLIGA